MIERRSFLARVLAIFMTKLMLLDMCYPTLVWALTGGPSQPEFESFEPIGTDQMVDLFTGDFNYNIPLLTVPGPNGGYPINLAYHAGIGMEQEASWVGLGWNINAGEINRIVRGIPDDFSGDEITKTQKMRDNVTVGFSRSTTNELIGGNIGLLSEEGRSLYYNTYKGLGYRRTRGLGVGVALKDANGNPKSSQSLKAQWSQVYDTQNGLDVQASISFGGRFLQTDHTLNGTAKWNSRQGLYSSRFAYRSTLDVNASGQRLGSENDQAFSVLRMPGASIGIDLASSSYVPAPNAKTTGQDFQVGLTWAESWGFEFSSMTSAHSYTGFFSRQRIKDSDETRHLPGFGYLYSEARKGAENGLMDLNREKDVPVTRYVKNAPMPVFTYDPYIIKGQGVGGAFRAFRSDIGLLHDESLQTTSDGGNVNGEYGGPSVTSTSWHFGANYGDVATNSYGGRWTSGTNAIGGSPSAAVDLGFQSKADIEDPLYEPFYFKSTAEVTASGADRWDHIGTDDPVRFKIGQASNGGFKNAPIVQNVLSGQLLTQNRYADRERRAQMIQYRTNNELVENPEYADRARHIYDEAEDPREPSSGSQIDRVIWPPHHLGELTVVNPDGGRYEYGLPVYNLEQKEVIFAVDPDDEYPTRVFPNISGAADNENGEDHFYSAIEVPPYVTAHLLTATYSPDYVDLTGDGPSDDDLGYYVKFNYTNAGIEEYKWRTPFRGVQYDKGAYSNDRDDKGSYAYGKKQIYYLHSIETKTHIAYFILNDAAIEPRKDAHAANSEENPGGEEFDTALRYLKEIQLKSKSDVDEDRILKTVKFGYEANGSKQLCQGTENCSAGYGKLTLKSVHFKSLGSIRGELSPYVFEYGMGSAYWDDPDQNPDYAYLSNDRWGNYKEDPADAGYTRTEHPYSEQDNIVGEHAGAWCLREIHLPSGGTIQVDYEPDDYGYVQDKRATRMCEIIGFGGTEDHLEDLGSVQERSRMSKDKLRVFFRMENGDDCTDDDTQAEEYLKGIDEVYFKVWVDLKARKDEPEIPAEEYIEGYAQIDTDEEIRAEGVLDGENVGSFVLESAHYGEANIGVHPIRLAAWQYLRNKRPDLLQTLNIGNGSSPLSVIVDCVNYFLESPGEFIGLPECHPMDVLLGFYGVANIKGYGKELGAFTSKPSFVRLNAGADRTKYGGGHRVAELRVMDNWSEDGGRVYGKHYDYITWDLDGNGQLDDAEIINMQAPEDAPPCAKLMPSSSGVASYEPLIGGEENALHRPVWYSSSDAKLVLNDEQIYLEEPFGESYFPGPEVGYGRVEVRDIDTEDPDHLVTKMRAGIAVHEFYTAKDFPVKTDRTALADVHYDKNVPIPFVGSEGYSNNGYSQGYAIELNDMHGKEKSVAEYKSTQLVEREDHQRYLDGQPVRRTTYVYHTDATDDKRLNNLVEVLADPWTRETAYLGQSVEFFVDLDEHTTKTEAIGHQFNIQTLNEGLWPFIPAYFPSEEYTESMYRAVVTNKIMHKHGILKEIITENEGNTIVERNLLYDPETGTPLLTSVTNSFDDPVYTYSNAAYQVYEGMAGAYENWGAQVLESVDIVSGTASVTDPERCFMQGDEVEAWSGNNILGVLFVVGVNSGANTIDLAEEDGSAAAYSDVTLKVRRSGRRNMQQSRNGTIVSLHDPVAETSLPALFQAYNDQISGNYVASPETLKYLDCNTGEMVEALIDANGSGSEMTFTNLTAEPECSIILAAAASSVTGGLGLGNITFIELDGTTIYYEDADGLQTGNWTDPADPEKCFPTGCISALHADATEMGDTWSYDYIDVGDPENVEGPLSDDPGNDYRYGRKGIWRPKKNWLFQIDRQKGGGALTNIKRDGEYRYFDRFDFSNPAGSDKHWVQREEMTRYSPYGYALESKDAVGVFSAELYGYQNSKVLATASNAGYYEMAFEGFEDHPGNAYASGHGHVNLSYPGGVFIGESGHTGKYSGMIFEDGEMLTMNATVDGTPAGNWAPNEDENYVVSAWFKTGTAQETPRIYIAIPGGGGSLITPIAIHENHPMIDGWRKVEVEFTAPSSTTVIQLQFRVDDQVAPARVDDIRVQPTDAAMTAFVYDPDLHWLKAELDERNYATFYSYDEEGILTQVKKETERGVQTLRTTRQNIKQVP